MSLELVEGQGWGGQQQTLQSGAHKHKHADIKGQVITRD